MKFLSLYNLHILRLEKLKEKLWERQKERVLMVQIKSRKVIQKIKKRKIRKKITKKKMTIKRRRISDGYL